MKTTLLVQLENDYEKINMLSFVDINTKGQMLTSCFKLHFHDEKKMYKYGKL